MKIAKSRVKTRKIPKSTVPEDAIKTSRVKSKEYTNLREVIDYSKPFELIYSGVENDSYYDILYDMGVRNFLMSYHYIQAKHLSLSKRFANEANVRLFIDSGAHTYQNDPKYLDYELDYWENHLQGYLKWAEKNKEFIFAIASFDFENVVGPDVVDRWNREYFEPFMLRTGIPVCFVWHQDSKYPWDFYCKRYPYVGFSSVNTNGESITIEEYHEKLKTAEKYDSVVHGFGMTRTSMLTELPFYTSDSTTWLVGLQYGEINYWKDTKMSRLKKDAWKGEYLDKICNKYHLNKDLLLDEDVVELIKANIGAFLDAENYIRTRLSGMMYWMKAKAIKNDLSDMSIFPTVDELSGNNLYKFAEKLNINKEIPDVNEIVFFATVFVNWRNPVYDDPVYWTQTDENAIRKVHELHDRFINRIVQDDYEMFEDLIQFFSECVSGENDFLLQLGTGFDRELKERDNYVEEEEEYDKVDISAEEVKLKLGNLLPTQADGEAPEIESLDEEVFRENKIVPTWGADGKLLKGQQLVRKPKQVYSKKYPKYACDTCYAAQRCPKYKAGYVCAFQKMFQRFDTRNQNDIIASIQGIVNHNMVRMQKAMIMETMNGVIDPVVSQLMETNIRYMNMLNQLYENSSIEVLRQSRVVRSDGSMEETTTVSNPQSGGIMSTLMSMLTKNDDNGKEVVVDVQEPEYEEENEQKEKVIHERYKNIED